MSRKKKRNECDVGILQRGRHFFPRFPVIRWALCLPSACSNEDARSIIQHALNGYNSTAGVKFIVHVDSNMNYVKHESSSYTKETIYVLYVSHTHTHTFFNSKNSMIRKKKKKFILHESLLYYFFLIVSLIAGVSLQLSHVSL